MRQLLKESHIQNRFRSLVRKKLKLKIFNPSFAEMLLSFLDEHINHASFPISKLTKCCEYGNKIKI
jgi:hypothetical protein